MMCGNIYDLGKRPYPPFKTGGTEGKISPRAPRPGEDGREGHLSRWDWDSENARLKVV